MLKKLKQATLQSLKTLGAFRVVQDSRWRRSRLLILAYHGVSLDDEHLWDGSMYMPPDCFAERMRALKKSGAVVLPLGEALERLYANDLPDRSVALTFDDGAYDFSRRAFPIIGEFGFPVTLYLTTFYSSFNKPVFDGFCSYLLWKGRSATLDLKGLTGQSLELNLSDEGARRETLGSLRRFARERALSAEEKDALLSSLAKRLKLDYDELVERRLLHLLKPEEVRALAEAGVDVQLHTHRHRTPLNRELFRREIEDNRAEIRLMTGRDATHFCYPSGAYDPAFLPWLEELGVRSATTCDTGYASRASARLLLPRLLDVWSLAPIEFEGWLTGVSAALPRRRESGAREGAAYGADVPARV
jgi:peptidoglycan/xylan/chitin deacetylase (PgdA/CDA1 family)